MNRLFILPFLLFLCLPAILQAQKLSKHTVYFDVDRFEITASEKTALESFIQQESNSAYISQVRITGHTDADASSAYNLKLSENRVKAVSAFFKGKIMDSLIRFEWQGENRPLNNNASSDEKKLNRRVEIVIEHWVPDLVETTGTIKELYEKLEQKKQVFCINPKGDTVIRLAQGTILYFPAEPFGKQNVSCIQIRAKEFYKKSDMILENLSTTSNGRLLESAGMIYMEAVINDSLLNLSPGKKVLVLMPTDTLREDMLGFNGERDPHTDIINWSADENNNFNLLRIPVGTPCFNLPYDLSLDKCVRCRFFFCRLKRIDEGLAGTVNNATHQANKQFRQCQRKLRRSQGTINVQVPLNAQTRDICKELDSLFAEYGVENRDDLLLAMNKEQMDQYGVKTLQELQDTLQKIKIAQIEKNLLSGNINQGDLQYYMYNTSNLGWINTDAFSKLAGEKKQMLTNLKADTQTDCKAAFVGVKGILPAYALENNFVFSNIPMKNQFWLIGLRFKDNQAYLSMKKTVSAENVEMAPFKKVSLEELKAALKGLD